MGGLALKYYKSGDFDKTAEYNRLVNQGTFDLGGAITQGVTGFLGTSLFLLSNSIGNNDDDSDDVDAGRSIQGRGTVDKKKNLEDERDKIFGEIGVSSTNAAELNEKLISIKNTANQNIENANKKVSGLQQDLVSLQGELLKASTPANFSNPDEASEIDQEAVKEIEDKIAAKEKEIQDAQAEAEKVRQDEEKKVEDIEEKIKRLNEIDSELDKLNGGVKQKTQSLKTFNGALGDYIKASQTDDVTKKAAAAKALKDAYESLGDNASPTIRNAYKSHEKDIEDAIKAGGLK